MINKRLPVDFIEKFYPVDAEVKKDVRRRALMVRVNEIDTALSELDGYDGLGDARQCVLVVLAYSDAEDVLTAMLGIPLTDAAKVLKTASWTRRKANLKAGAALLCSWNDNSPCVGKKGCGCRA